MAGMVWGKVEHDEFFALPDERLITVYKDDMQVARPPERLDLTSYEGKTVLLTCQREVDAGTTEIYGAICRGVLGRP